MKMNENSTMKIREIGIDKMGTGARFCGDFHLPSPRLRSRPQNRVPVPILKNIILYAIFVIAFFSYATPTFAASVYFQGHQLPHDYLTFEQHQFVALDDIAGPLGLSVVDQRHDLLIGGAVRGSLTIDTRFHLAKVGDQQIDFAVHLHQDHGLWYVPDQFLDLALGLLVRPKPSTQDIVLYPEVVSITPTKRRCRDRFVASPRFHHVRARRSAPTDCRYQRRFLQGPNLNIPGAMLCTDRNRGSESESVYGRSSDSPAGGRMVRRPSADPHSFPRP